jgi:hypothetical protein
MAITGRVFYTGSFLVENTSVNRGNKMENLTDSTPYKRIKGGFRRIIETELGEEQFCGACHEFWPMDAEFFNVSERSVGYECKACLIDRKMVRSRS